MKAINQFIQFLVPDIQEKPAKEARKFRVLIWLILFIMGFTVPLDMVIMLLHPEYKTFGSLWIVAGFIIWAFHLKKTGNILASINFVCATYVYIVANYALDNGGIYSDNMVWLIAAPILAFFIGNIWSGVFWSLALLGITYYFYYIEVLAGRPQAFAMFSPDYYMLSYASFYSLMLAIVAIFINNERSLVKEIEYKNVELELQQDIMRNQHAAIKETEEKLKKTNKELEQFAYTASHDLKEPLRMVKSYVQLLQRAEQHHLSKESELYMQHITDGVARMQRLLDDLLEYSRLGNTPMKKMQVELQDIMLGVVHNLMVPMQEKSGVIITGELPQIIGNPTEMIRLFQNLISNALKFAKPGESPVVEVSAWEHSDYFLFSIKDNGVGIAKEHHQRVFEVFHRLSNTEKVEGTGIGLASVRKIVNNNGGEIWVESELGIGTTFFFTYPKHGVVKELDNSRNGTAVA